MSRLLSNPNCLLFLLLLFLLLLVFPAGFVPPALAINLGARWEYIQRGGEDRPTQTEIQELYYLGFGSQLTYRPTHAISLNAGATYRRNQGDRGQGTHTYNALDPYMQLNLANDIFHANIAGRTAITLSELNDKTTERSFSSWETTLANSWNIPLWPNLRFSFGEQFVPVRSTSIFASTSQKQRNSSFIMNWDLILAQLHYNYSQNQNVIPDINFLQESSSHFARFETLGRLWDNRLNFTFSQRFKYSTLDTTITDRENPFPDDVPGKTLSKVDQEGDPLPPSLFYDDPNLDLPQAVDINDRVHFWFTTESNFPESIDILLLTLQDSFTVPQALELQWNLYTRTDTTAEWELVNALLQGQASALNENSIEIPIGLSATEILVMSSPADAPLNFTNLEALSIRTVGSGISKTGYLTDFSLAYRITRSLQARTTLSLNHSETTSGNISNEQDRRFVSASLHWTPIPLVSPTLQFSENRRSATATATDSVNRNYSLIVSTRPLPIMNISYGVSLDERYKLSQKNFSSTRYSIVTSAQIYPDLTASWQFNYILSEILDNDGLIKNSTAYNTRLNLAAKLYQTLTANFITNYGYIKSDDGSAGGGSMLFSLQYIPSDLLRLSGTYRTSYLVPELTDKLNLNFALQLLNTYKTNLFLTASHSMNVRRTENNTTTENVFLDGNWEMNRSFSLQGRANYTLADKQSYGFRLLVVLRLL